jgi:hypothetical protein
MRSLLFPLLLMLALAGCTGQALRSPAGVDLTGTWQLDPARSDTGALHEHHHDADMGERQMAGQAEQPSSPGGFTEPNHESRGHVPPPRLPMLTATEMTIAQDATSMGIAYPNQPYRDLKWGKQKHDLYVVQAGWEKNQLVVETTSTPLHVKETYTLSDDGNTLTLRVDLGGRAFDNAHVVRVFTRRSAA